MKYTTVTTKQFSVDTASNTLKPLTKNMSFVEKTQLTALLAQIMWLQANGDPDEKHTVSRLHQLLTCDNQLGLLIERILGSGHQRNEIRFMQISPDVTIRSIEKLFGSDKYDFYIIASRKHIHNAAVLLKTIGKEITLAELEVMCTNQDIIDERVSLFNDLIKQDKELILVQEYFREEWRSLHPSTKYNIVATITNCIYEITLYPYRVLSLTNTARVNTEKTQMVEFVCEIEREFSLLDVNTKRTLSMLVFVYGGSRSFMHYARRLSKLKVINQS